MTRDTTDRLVSFEAEIDRHAHDLAAMVSIESEFERMVQGALVRRGIPIVEATARKQGGLFASGDNRTAIAFVNMGDDGVFRLSSRLKDEVFRFEMARVGQGMELEEPFLNTQADYHERKLNVFTGFTDDIAPLILASNILARCERTFDHRNTTIDRSNLTAADDLLDADGGLIGPMTLGLLRKLRQKALALVMNGLRERIDHLAYGANADWSEGTCAVMTRSDQGQHNSAVRFEDPEFPFQAFTARHWKSESFDLVILKTPHGDMVFDHGERSLSSLDHSLQYPPKLIPLVFVLQLLRDLDQVEQTLEASPEPPVRCQRTGPDPCPSCHARRTGP